jgi:hypothetical protein
MPDELESVEVPVVEDDISPEDIAEKSANKLRSYYYDDAHGYEDFDPDSEVGEGEDV